MRGWPSWKTSSTDVVAASAPTEMMPAAMLRPRSLNAVASGSAVPRWFQGTSPVSTSVTAM